MKTCNVFTVALFVGVLVGVRVLQAESPDEALARLVRQPAEDAPAVLDLLKKGAHPGLIADNEPLLGWAARMGHVNEMLELIQAGADVNAANGDPVFAAIAGGKPEALLTLLNAGADPNPGNSRAMSWLDQGRALGKAAPLAHAGPSAGTTPLHEAARNNAPEFTILLLNAGAHVDALDARHQTPLMCAAAAGVSFNVFTLLQAGADPALKDSDGKVAVEIARAAKQDQAAIIIVDFETKHTGAPESALHPAPGDDLAKIVNEAKDGQVIILGPGNYKGPVQIADKSLVIRGAGKGKTVLTCGQVGFALLEKGKLDLQGMSVQAGDNTDLALYVQGGAAVIHDCSFSGMKSNGCYAKGGSLVITACEFQKTGQVAVAASDGATLTVRDSKFTDCPAGVSAQGGKSLCVCGCDFNGTPAAVQSLGADCTVAIRENTGSLAPGGKEQSTGIYVENGSRVVIAANQITNYVVGIAIKGAVTFPVVLDGNAVVNAHGAFNLGVRCQNSAYGVSMRQNVICNSHDYAMLFDQSDPSVIFGNVAIAREGLGMAFQNKSGAVLYDNIVYAPVEAVALRDTPPAQLVLRTDRIIGPVAPGGDAPQTDPATQRFLAAAAVKDARASLAACAEKILTGAQAGGDADAAAFTSFADALAVTEKSAAKLAQVSFHIVDMAGQTYTPEFAIYAVRGEQFGELSLVPQDILDPAALLELLRSAKDPVSHYLHDQFSPALQQQIAAADVKNPPPQVLAAVIAELNNLMTRESWLGTAQIDGVTLAPVTLEARASAGSGSTAAQKLRANRNLLEDAFPELIASSRRLATKSEKDRWAFLPAGSYWLVPTARPSLGLQVAVQAGQTSDPESQADNAIVLKFRKDDKTAPERILLMLKTPEQMRETIAKIRLTNLLRDQVVFPRVGATKEEIENALTLARKDFAKYCADPAPDVSKDLKPDEIQALKGKYWRARTYAERIFAAYGEEKDVEFVVTNLLANNLPLEAARLAAYMESRLGILDHGSMVKALNGKNAGWSLAAAIELHAFGISSGDACITAGLSHPSPEDHVIDQLAGFALLDVTGNPALETARNFLTELDKDKEFAGSQWDNSYSPYVPAIIYLLAYGDKSDWKRVAGYEEGRCAACFLAYLADDPTPLANFVASTKDYYWLRLMTPAFRAIPARADALVKSIEGAIYSVELPPNAWTGQRMDANGRATDFEMDITFWRPSEKAAEFLCASKSWTDFPNWSPWHGAWDDGTANWLGWPMHPQGVGPYLTYYRDEQLDYFPSDEILKRFAALADKDKVFAQDLFTAAYQTTTSEFSTTLDDYHDGIERRPYLLRKPDSGKGAISGVLSVQPSLSGRTLHLPLRLDQRVYYIKFNMYDDFHPETLDIYPYVEKNGRKLITAVRVLRGNTAFPVTEQGADQNGNLLFDAELDKPDLSGVYLQVDFQFFDQEDHLIFDLFDSDYASQLRQQH